MIKRYVYWMKKYPRILFVFLLLSVVLSVAGIRQLTIDVGFDMFTSQDSAYADTMARLNERFITNQLTVLLKFEGGSFGEADLLKSISVVQKAQLLNSFEVMDLPFFALDELGPLSPITVQEDAVYFRLDLPIKETLTVDDLQAMESFLDDLGVPYYLAGDDYMQNKLFDYILSILKYLPPLAIGSIFLVFSWQMGSIKATLLSVLPAIIASLWTMGFVGWFGEGVSITTVLAPIFTLIIGSADGLHFVSHFQEAYSLHGDKEMAVTETLEMVGMPMIITTLTTMVGFLSLIFVREPVVTNLVVLASLGVLLAGFATWWFLPLIMLSRMTLKRVKVKNARILVFLKRFWGKPVMGLLVFLVVLTMVFLPALKTEFNQLMFYKENTALYQSFVEIEKATGGGVPLMVAFEWHEGESPYDISKTIEDALSHHENISRVVGIGQLSETMRVNMGEGQFLDKDHRIGRVIAFPSTFSDDSLASIEMTMDGLKLSYPIKVTSVQYIMNDLNQHMVASQVPTQLLALSLVFILILLVLRKIVVALVALLPIVLTMFFLYGYLAITGIPLNLFTILMFSISIGIGIDYAIHFISVWSSFRKRGVSAEGAIDHAFQYTSRPILANAMGLAMGMSALMLSPLKIHTYLSMVMWFTMTASVFLTLTVLPTVLTKMKR